MKEKRRILAIVSASYFFGAEKISLDVFKGLKNNGFSIHCIVSGWNDGDFIERLKKNGISYTEVKLGWYYISKLSWTLDSLIHYPGAILDFIKTKQSFIPHLYYTISYRQLVLLFPLIPSSSVIYNVQDSNAESRLSKFFLKLVDIKVKKYIACSNYIKNDLIKCGIDANKIHVIHNGVEILEKKSVFSNEILTLGIVGQVIPRKGHKVLIEALRCLHERGVNLNLKIVGTGDVNFTKEIEYLVHQYGLENSVSWSGFVKNYSEIYAGIDILIAPTQNEEPFGLIAAEANMFGIPVIVSNKGGLTEIIEDGYNGYRFNADDAEDLACKILLLHEDRQKMKLMGLNGREKVISNFSFERMNKSVLELINEQF
ncbi:MAG: glycosyltransferase family 4 protein [Chitinophagaceae bacterium]